jgi:hypothetical protein
MGRHGEGESEKNGHGKNRNDGMLEEWKTKTGMME